MREQEKHTESWRISDEKNRTSGAFLSVYSVWKIRGFKASKRFAL
jgi:hypothetical protein